MGQLDLYKKKKNKEGHVFDPNNLTKEEEKKLNKLGFKNDFLRNNFIRSAQNMMVDDEVEGASLDDYINVYNTAMSLPNYGASRYTYDKNGQAIDIWKDYVNKAKIHRNGDLQNYEGLTPEERDNMLFDRFASEGEVARRYKDWYDTWIPYLNKMASHNNYDWFNENSTRKYIEGNNDPYALQKNGDSTLIRDPKTGRKYEVLTMTDSNGNMTFIPGPDGLKHGFRTLYSYDQQYRTPLIGEDGQYTTSDGYRVNSEFTPRAEGKLPDKPLKNPIILPNGQYQVEDHQQSNAQGGHLNRYYADGGPMGQIPLGEQPEDYNMVGEGGMHEENPMGGVPYGINQDGSQNMVEEGEVSVGDNVFSNRTQLSPELCQQLGMPEGTTPAEAMQQIEQLYEQGQLSDEEFQEVQEIIFQDQESQKQAEQGVGGSYQQGMIGGPGVQPQGMPMDNMQMQDMQGMQGGMPMDQMSQNDGITPDMVQGGY